MNELQFPGLYIDDTANPHQLSSGYRLCGNSRTLPMDGCVSP